MRIFTEIILSPPIKNKKETKNLSTGIIVTFYLLCYCKKLIENHFLPVFSGRDRKHAVPKAHY